MYVALYFRMAVWNVAYSGPTPTDIIFDKRVWFQTTNEELNINTSTSIWEEMRRQTYIRMWGPMKRVFSHLVNKEHYSDLVLETVICQLIMYRKCNFAPRPKNLESGYRFRMTNFSLNSDWVKDNIFQISYHGWIYNGFCARMIRKM
jgi:hypothetical protein